MSLEPKSRDPDWARVGVTHPANLASPGLGDPTRWGSKVALVSEVRAGRQILQSGQLVNAQCRDGYPRTWSALGQLSWMGFVNALPDGGLGPDSWAAVLSVTMGVGQNQVTHNMNLRALIAADAPFYWGSDETFGGLIGMTSAINKPFITPGAIIGELVSIGLTIVLVLAAPPPYALQFACGVHIAPMAAGDGL